MTDDILGLQRSLADVELRGDADQFDALLAEDVRSIGIQQPDGWGLAALQFSTLGSDCLSFISPMRTLACRAD